MSYPTAAIIIIGNEILSGRTRDANLAFLGQHLTKIGIEVKEAAVLRDEEVPIIQTVRTFKERYTYLFTTGGIGATHDDITAACLAKAVNKPLIYHPEAVAILKDYYQEKLNDARLRMALMPEEAILIDNPISKAPGFQIENIFCLAGVPSIMQAMFYSLEARLNQGPPIYQHTLTCELAENHIADEFAFIQQEFPDVEMGSYPFFQATGTYGVNLVLRSRNKEILETALQRVQKMINEHNATPFLTLNS